VGVPWFGALGAVIISLTGVFEHEHDWDDSYWPWHVARPLIGAALGVVSVLILQAGVLAVGSTPLQPGQSQTVSTSTSTPAPTPNQPGASATPTPGSNSQNQTAPTKIPSNLLYYLVAFLVGYREETFRELIKRLVDIILAPGSTGPPAPIITGVVPPQVPHAAPTAVVITGSGFTGTQSVKFGDALAQNFSVDADGKLTAMPLAAAAGGPATIKVTTKGGSATIPFSFS
jgi:hypothetical protein